MAIDLRRFSTSSGIRRVSLEQGLLLSGLAHTVLERPEWKRLHDTWPF
jgi:hypothetical protein